MTDKECDKTIWSLGDSEGSNDGPEDTSINTQLDSLQLNSSWDSCKSEENLPRGKLPKTKINKQSTSKYMLDIMQPSESNKSPEHSSSISPSSEYPSYQFSPLDIYSMIGCRHVGCDTFPGISPQTLPKKKSNKNLIKIILQDRLHRKKSKSHLNQWIFEFGDTNLIKCCRLGQISVIEETIKELIENQQYRLIDHQNSARETALSIATYQMNEIMIDLLLKYGASPKSKLAMNNNVLHIAASMTDDIERKTFGYLINAIKTYQFDNVFETITAKNVFNYDPITILRLYRDSNLNNPYIYDRIQYHINHTQALINAFYKPLYID